MIVRIDNSKSKYYSLLRENSINFENNPFIRYYIYISNNKLVGYLSFEYIYDRFEIDNIFVFNEYRNKGIGSLLINSLIEYGFENKIINITLEVNKNNTIALKLYSKYGFVKKAIREKYYNGQDGILMEKEMIR